MRRFLHHLFFPHEANNHRPRLLHHQNLFSLILFLLLVFAGASFMHKNYPQVLGISSNISVQDLLSLTNQKRQENGLSPLILNAQLSLSATMKAQDMMAKNYWAHVAPDGTTPWYFIKSAGYEYLYAGENLARGFTSAAEIVNAWMASPSHRENILSSNYTEVGFAEASGNLTGADTILVVQMFGKKFYPKPEVSPAMPEIAGAVNPSPTPQLIVQITAVPTALILPSPTLAPSITPEPSPQLSPRLEVAAIHNNPLIDGKSLTRQGSIALLVLFLAVLIVDAIIIERKKIIRVVSHNLDHIIFLAILLITAIILGKGLIL